MWISPEPRRKSGCKYCSCFVLNSALYKAMYRQTAVRGRLPDPDLSHFGPAGGMWEVGAEPHAELVANTDVDGARRRGRGALTNASGRFEPRVLVAFDDGWQSIEELPPFKTEVALDTSRKVITRNTSIDCQRSEEHTSGLQSHLK